MTLEGEKVSLRAVEPTDEELLFRWENDASLWVDGCAVAPFSKFQLQRFIETAADVYAMRQLRLMVVDCATGATVGCVDLSDFDPRAGKAEVSVLIDRSFRGRGFATEALQLMEVYAFNFLFLHQLYACIRTENKASVRLFASLDYERVAALPDWYRTADGWCDCLLYRKLNF